MIAKLGAAAKQSIVSAFFLALVYAGQEDKDDAFSWLDKACEGRFNRLAYARVRGSLGPAAIRSQVLRTASTRPHPTVGPLGANHDSWLEICVA
jgi:hypothetical protein